MVLFNYSTKELTVTGTIKESGYEHPHGHVRLAAPGKVWLVVLAPPSRMTNREARPEVVAVGKTVSAFGYPSTRESGEMRAERITVDGKTYEMR